MTGQPYLYGMRLYLPTDGGLLVLDVSDPDAPKFLKETPFPREQRAAWWSLFKEEPAATIALPMLPLEGLPPPRRLAATMAMIGRPAATVEGTDLVLLGSMHGGGLGTYRVRSYDETANLAHMELVGRCRATPLERLINEWPQTIACSGDRAYALCGFRQSSLLVYDVSDPARPRKIGHYAERSRTFSGVLPLGGGRALLGGESLEIVGK
jgi:hypothetical protein